MLARIQFIRLQEYSLFVGKMGGSVGSYLLKDSGHTRISMRSGFLSNLLVIYQGVSVQMVGTLTKYFSGFFHPKKFLLSP